MTRRLASDLSVIDRNTVLEALALSNLLYCQLHEDTGGAESAAESNRIVDLMGAIAPTVASCRAAETVARTLLEATRAPRQMKEADLDAEIPY